MELAQRIFLIAILLAAVVLLLRAMIAIHKPLETQETPPQQDQMTTSTSNDTAINS